MLLVLKEFKEFKVRPEPREQLKLIGGRFLINYDVLPPLFPLNKEDIMLIIIKEI